MALHISWTTLKGKCALDGWMEGRTDGLMDGGECYNTMEFTMLVYNNKHLSWRNFRHAVVIGINYSVECYIFANSTRRSVTNLLPH